MKFSKPAAFIFLVAFFSCLCIITANAQPSRFSYSHYINGKGDTLHYRMLTPDYTTHKYPLVIFLHGSGERGNNNEAQLKWGVMNFATDEMMSAHPAIVVAPQCPANMSWHNFSGRDGNVAELRLQDNPSKPMELLIGLIHELIKKAAVDTNRIYITGLSMGGFGTYDAIERYPNLFAAAVPVCGGGDVSKASAIAHIPIWILHGAEDASVDPHFSTVMVDALMKRVLIPALHNILKWGIFHGSQLTVIRWFWNGCSANISKVCAEFLKDTHNCFTANKHTTTFAFMEHRTKLSVNINKIATLRNSRGGNNPDVLKAAIDVQRFGADGVTVHPRPDERHIRYSDVRAIKNIITTEFNIEGNCSEQKFVDLVLETKPQQVTLVPDALNQITSDHGWNTVEYKDYLQRMIKIFKDAGIRVSIFVDPIVEMVEGAAQTGTDRIELYTESYAKNFQENKEKAVAPYINVAQKARELGLGLNAGHDLDLHNLKYFKQNIPWLDEVSIGHALISDALYLGLENTVQMYKRQLM